MKAAPANANTTPRTAAQNRAIYGVRAALQRAGLDADSVDTLTRDLCRQVSGQEHTAQLTVAQANALLELLRTRIPAAPQPQPAAAKRPHEPWGARQAGDRDELPVTERQIEVVALMCMDAGFVSLPQRVGFFARQLQGRRRLETQRDADLVIEGLKAIILRRQDVAELERRTALVVAQVSRLNPWLQRFVADFAARLERDGKAAATAGRLAKLTEAEAALGLRAADAG